MAIQVVLSLVLLYGAALLTQSLVKQRSLDPGFRVKGVLGVMLHPNPGGYKDLDRVSYDRQLFDALSGLPGVSSVSLSALAPIDPFTHREALSSDSVDANAPGSVEADVAKISPGFFKTLGMSLLQGRDFYFSDDQRAGRVIIVSSALARRLFGSADPIGRVINVGVSPQHQRLRVIGIVGDARLYDIRQNLSFAAYLPFFQEDKTGAAYVEIAADTNLAHIAAVVRRTVNRFGREYVFRVESLGQREDALLASERAVTTLANGFAVLALSLAVVGLYGLMSYSVAGRTGEFGIRMAMGASPADVLHLVVRESLLLVSAAAVVGFPIAMVTGRTVSGILYGVKAISPMVLLASSGTLLVAGLLAAWIPARRASRIEPMTALRHE
jgi:putative ABC transport system permease protein